jgi:phage shock protein E
MKNKIAFIIPVVVCVALPARADTITNRLIDYPGYLKIAREVQPFREQRRVTEEQFLSLAAKSGTLILDARSESKYKLRHVKGAINLPFTEFTEAALARAIPAKDTPILIYCNNNFLGSPVAFEGKAMQASLNISTYVALTIYGYTNIYELGPLIDIKSTRLVFDGQEVSRAN